MAQNTNFPEEELADYDEEEEQLETDNIENIQEPKVDASYATLATSSFKDFMLKKELMKAIEDAGFEHPSEVQHEAIPKAIQGNDMIVQAKSGMGKTAVFVITTLQLIEPEPGVVDTLVICHTREMAFQIASEFERFKKYFNNVKIGVVYGGVPFHESKRIITQEKPNILIGTPGRINHLWTDGCLKFDKLKRFIIDECDNMLLQNDMRKQVQNIFILTPLNKQVMMFSATISQESKVICRKFTKNSKEIFIDDKKLTLHGLVQHYVKLEERQKNRKLTDLLDALDFNQVVIFVKTKQRAIQLNRLLQECAFPSICIHSDMSQTERLDLFKKFKAYEHRILISTNLFGRGVDIERVNIVINYDMPQDSDEYLHRVGRAGRFGTKGLAITFIASSEEQTILDKIQERFKVKVTELPNEIQASTYM